MENTTALQPKSKLLPILIAVTLVLAIAMYFVFQYANNDLAGKTCLQVVHQLQGKYVEEHGTYADTAEKLQFLDAKIVDAKKPNVVTNGIDARCSSYFNLKIVRADLDGFTAQISTDGIVMTIDEMGLIIKK